MAGRFSIEATFRADDKFSRPLQRIESRFGRFSRQATAGLDKMGSAVKSFAVGLGAAGIAAGTAALVGAAAALKDIVELGSDFEKTMVAAGAKFSPSIRAGTEQFKRLEETAKLTGSTTEFSASQAAAALKDLASAGFNVDSAIAGLPTVVNLATAAEIDLATASDIAGKSLGAFGLKTTNAEQLAKNLARTTDVMARTADATSSSLQGLFETFKEAGPVATAAGISIETVSAMAGKLSDAGIEGSVAGTTLKNALLTLSAPSDEAARALGRLGIKTKTASGELRNPIETLGLLQERIGKLGQAEQAAKIEQIFGKIPIAGVSVLMQTADATAQLERELGAAAGSLDRMAGIMRDTTAGDLATFKSSVEGLKLEVFDVVKGPLREIIKAMSEWTAKNKEWIASGIGETITSIKNGLTAMQPALQFVKDHWETISTTLKGVAIAFGVLAAIFAVGAATLLAPFYLLIAVVGLVIGKLADFVGWVRERLPAVGEFFKSVWTGVSDFFVGLWERIKAPVIAALEFIVGVIALAVEGFRRTWAPVGEFIAGVWNVISDAAEFVWFKIQELWAPVSAWFSEKWTTIKDAFKTAWDTVVETAGTIYDKIKEVFSPIVSFFTGLWDGIVAAFDRIVGPIIDTIGSVVNSIRGVGAGVLGTDGPGAAPSRPEPQTSSAAGRAAERIISETSTTHTEKNELVIRTEGGARAELKKPPPKGSRIRLQPSGAF